MASSFKDAKVFKDAKALYQKMLKKSGLSSRTVRLAAAAVPVSAGIDVVGGVVISQRVGGSAGGATLALFACLICINMVQEARKAQPAGTDVPLDEIVTGLASYGVVRLPAGTEISLGRFFGTVMSSAYGELPAGSAENETGPVNLENERRELKRALEGDRSNVILVHGPPGAGKSTLVSAVLREMRLESRARRHELAPRDRLDAKALLDDIESGRWAGAALKLGENVLGRLEAVMEARRGSPVVIVVDGAQSLFETGNHMDGQLAEALEIIASGRRRVKVILIAADLPVPGAGSSWHGTADLNRIFVGGLRREDFNTFLERLNPAFEFSLTDRTTTELGELYDVLQGNPRQAEMFCAALGLPESRLRADELARLLAREQSGKREVLLASAVVNSLSQDQRCVVAALAAYGIPVTIEHVNELLAENADELSAGKLSAGQVDVLAEELVNWRVIDRATGKAPNRYYLSASEIYNALLQSGDLYADLLFRAAVQLLRYQTPEERIREPEDLRWHFAELDILVREAQMNKSYDDPSGPLYDEINRMERVMKPVLRRWNAEGLLLKYREAIKDNLKKPYQEMVNSNALGCIYMSRGRFDDARRAFEDALQRVDDANARSGRRKILINRAALSWNSGKTSDAKNDYNEAIGEDYSTRKLAEEPDHGDALDQVAAEAGLADCYRRWGRYSDAICHGMKALSAVRAQRSPSSVESSVDIAVKLARWLSELHQWEEAGRLMKEARRAARHNPALRVRCLAGHADLLLDADHYRRAGMAAMKAHHTALRLRDTDTVLRAGTTLAMACLMLRHIPGRIRAARHAIDRASRCRSEDRFLDVLALQALVAFRSNPDGEEARGLFAQLNREAAWRCKRDEKDFAARAFQGLAICGAYVCETNAPLDRVEEFQDARKLTSAAPVLDAQLRRWLKILGEKAAPGQLDPVMAAIGAASELGRS